MAERLPLFVSLLSLRARRRDYPLSATITVSVGVTYDSPRMEQMLPCQMSRGYQLVSPQERRSFRSERANLSPSPTLWYQKVSVRVSRGALRGDNLSKRT